MFTWYFSYLSITILLFLKIKWLKAIATSAEPVCTMVYYVAPETWIVLFGAVAGLSVS